jgi:hypothetical protein
MTMINKKTDKHYVANLLVDFLIIKTIRLIFLTSFFQDLKHSRENCKMLATFSWFTV